MNKYVSVDVPTRKYGHWFMMPNGMSLFSSRNPDENHIHYSLMKENTDVKNMPKIAMHGFPVSHEGNNYKIENTNVKYNDIEHLAKAIHLYLSKNYRIKNGKNDNDSFRTMNFGASNLSGLMIGNGEKTLYIIKDANGQTVMATFRKNNKKNNSEEETQAMLKYVSEYLAHEHHRAAISIAGHMLLSHAPDHICFNESPLHYWPNSQSGTIHKNPFAIEGKV